MTGALPSVLGAAGPELLRRHVSYFSALSVMARTNRRWKIRNTSRIGMIEMTEAAIDRPAAIAPFSSVKLVSPMGSV